MKPYSISIILPVINETFSLTETVRTIWNDVPYNCLEELLIVVCGRTTPAALAEVKFVQQTYHSKVVVIQQDSSLPFYGGALRNAINHASGTHVLLMSSDLETDPADVGNMVRLSRANPDKIINASRWLLGGKFEGYFWVKLVCNWLFNHFFALLYGVKVTDMTYGYRILPTTLAQSIRWEEYRHPFNLETIVKPLRLGVEVLEVPTAWRARNEGESQNTFWRNFAYFRTGLKVRFAAPKTLTKP
jgi:glycosyltransferase involved in cell wall biosynthesis